MLYVNQAGTSWPKPAAVREAVADVLDTPFDAWADSFDTGKTALAETFGVRDPARLLLTPNATSALSVGILDLPWQSGDRVVISGLEHHALHRPVQQLVARGVEIVVIPPGDGTPFALGRLEEELGRGGVRLVAITAASNVTGDLLPIEDIVARAHAHDALAMIDAAQVAGWIPIDVHALDVDLLAFTGHKALQGPWGIGGLYVADRVRMDTLSAACELPSPGKEPSACAPMPGYCDVGSVDRAALAGVAAGIEWLDAPVRRDRLAIARAQVEFVEAALDAIPGVRRHAFTPAAERLPTVAFTFEGLPAMIIGKLLARRGAIAGAGLQCAPMAHQALGTDPDGVVRISFGPANLEGDEEILADFLRDVIPSEA